MNDKLNIVIDRRLELIFAIHSVYLRKTKSDDLDWIESPMSHIVMISLN